MAKLSTKHANMERLSWADFSGGLNLIKPGEAIEMNEQQEASNFEFSEDAGLFKVRGGIMPRLTFEEPVRDMFAVAGTDMYIARVGTHLYRVVDQQPVLLGEVEGTGAGSFEYWGENGGVVMAFGGPLYVYDADNDVLSKVMSPNCPTAINTVFYRTGRIAVVEDASDTIRYSGIGDPYMWTDNPDDDSTSKSVDIGYKDGCNINAVGELGGELIVFKSPVGQPEHGRIYRLMNEFPNWEIRLYSKGMSAWSSKAVQTLGDDLLFITKEGVSSMATTDTYGDFKLSWPGLKINPRFARSLDDKCRIWPLSPRGQVWFSDSNSSEIFIYHYQIGSGAWTKFEMPGIVTSVARVTGIILLSMGNTVYEFSDIFTNDTIVDAVTGNAVEVAINAFWKPKTIIRRNQILTKMIMANYLAGYLSKAELVVERLRIPLPANDSLLGDVAAIDYDIAVLDTDPLFENKTSVIRKRVQFVRWDITPRLEIVNGLFSIASVVFEIAEV